MWRRADSFSQNVSEAGRQTRHDPPDGAQKRKALNFNTNRRTEPNRHERN